MDSALPCLIDGMVLLEGLRSGALESMCAGGRIAVGRLLLQSLHADGGNGAQQVLELSRVIDDGRIQVMDASAAEFVGVLRWVGSQSLGAVELEQVAVVLAGRASLWSVDRAVVRVVRELGLEESLVEGSSLRRRCHRNASLISGDGGHDAE